MSRILVVDDDRATRQVLNSVLTKAGFSVTTANDGLAALDKMRHRRFATQLEGRTSHTDPMRAGVSCCSLCVGGSGAT